MNANPSLIVKAKRLAFQAHAHQMYDDMPFIYHLLDVATIMEIACERVRMIEQNYQELVAACWLHDIIEDTSNTYNDVLVATNKNVAELVYAVSDELGRNRVTRKQLTYPKTLKAGPLAVCVKICDRWANSRHNGLEHDKGGMYLNEFDEFAEWFAPRKDETPHALHKLLWDGYEEWFNRTEKALINNRN